MLVNNALNTEQQDAEDLLRRIRNRYDACEATRLSTAHCVHVDIRRSYFVFGGLECVHSATKLLRPISLHELYAR